MERCMVVPWRHPDQSKIPYGDLDGLEDDRIVICPSIKDWNGTIIADGQSAYVIREFYV